MANLAILMLNGCLTIFSTFAGKNWPISGFSWSVSVKSWLIWGLTGWNRSTSGSNWLISACHVNGRTEQANTRRTVGHLQDILRSTEEQNVASVNFYTKTSSNIDTKGEGLNGTPLMIIFWKLVNKNTIKHQKGWHFCIIIGRHLPIILGKKCPCPWMFNPCQLLSQRTADSENRREGMTGFIRGELPHLDILISI